MNSLDADPVDLVLHKLRVSRTYKRLLNAQAIELIHDLRARVARLEEERDEADRFAGLAYRRLEGLRAQIAAMEEAS